MKVSPSSIAYPPFCTCLQLYQEQNEYKVNFICNLIKEFPPPPPPLLPVLPILLFATFLQQY